jgi:hypothetical protein
MARIGRPPIVLLASSNDGFRPELPFATRFTNGLSWSAADSPEFDGSWDLAAIRVKPAERQQSADAGIDARVQTQSAA